jgi:SAM-dependent methyltransferase
VSSGTQFYGDTYYAWQRCAGQLGAELDSWKFRPFLNPHVSVLDFGCGGGFMLASLPASERWGIEVNPVAAREASTRLDRVVGNIQEIPVGKQFDAILSHHALEHVENPLEILRELRIKLRPGGTTIFIVPAECWIVRSRYNPADVNQHLYTWTPLLLGHLFVRAGYRVESIKTLCHRWPPKPALVRRFVGGALFDPICRMTALLTLYRQLRIVAKRPSA